MQEIDEKQAHAKDPRTEKKGYIENLDEFEEVDDSKPYFNEDGEEDSPYAVVRATVSNKDDPSLPTLTFRFWLISVPLTIAVAMFNQMFWFRTINISIGNSVIILIILPLGRWLARVLPDRLVKVGPFSFSLNPGPFNAKEHALMTTCVTSAVGVAYAVDIVVIKELFYHSPTPIIGSILLTLTTQCVGYGLAGVCYKYLVRPAAMMWPSNLMYVAVFRTFHDRDEGAVGGMTRMRFFLLVTAASAIYYFLPGYLFTMLSAISVLCLAMPNNVLANQIGSYTKGMGVLSFTLDWSNITANVVSPLMMPFWAVANGFVGFIVLIWILLPIGYYNNLLESINLPFISSGLFTPDAKVYPTLNLVDKATLNIKEDIYAEVGAPRMSFMFAMCYGIGFAGLAAVISHVFLYYGKDIVRRFRESRGADDIHARMMDKYDPAPQWWYIAVLAISTGLSVFVCEYYGTQLPWWGVLLSIGMAAFFILPIGIITAISTQTPGLNIITEFVIGYILPGNPMANVTFKTYGYIGMYQGIVLLGDLKLGHYMKIPPRHMFISQMTGTIIAGVFNVIAAYLMFSVEGICDPKLNPEWSCRSARVFYSASVIWGVIGPDRMFGAQGYYSILMWFFLIGALLPVPFWLLSRRYPKSWVKYINIPVMLACVGGIPPAYTGAFPTWFILSFIFQFLVFRYRRTWWSRYNYILSAGLDAGVAIGSFIIFWAFQNNHIEFDWWGNQPDCPLLD
ncbi:oligopeptide transporter OPT family [Thamnocephalis sphaerospora]|uniref:Oligopeptide transporter OPT family n=1 Tax=Thamnocephalis sphaerospora TaxID=78915 RepID=A0A4P9XY97_9FUNG|nr:oligopeptide transporter OPT family [Thamnocephalis sphaerospora]|eukprot:RKP10400.1 oligopeptide transporter OPT family [Thamnocephalis sphaerospora]